jgi:hypothetical protein
MAPPQSVVNTVPAAAVQPAPAPFDWRAHLPVHPAAALYPLMAEADPAAFKDLVEDIKTNGLIEPLVFWNIDGQFILDGRNRLDALASLGLLYETPDHHVGIKTWTVGKGWSDKPAGRLEFVIDTRGYHDGDPYAIALSLNVHRRHLDAELKRKLIADVLKARPEKSNNQIAKEVKADDKTVAKVRRELEATSEIPRLEKTVGTDGKARPTKVVKGGEKPTMRPAAESNSPAPTKTMDGAKPAAEPNGIPSASQRALKEVKTGLTYWFPKITNRDDRQAAIDYFCKVAGLPAINGRGVA